jgi:glycerate kinase
MSIDRPVKMLFASDSFKGSLSSKRTAELLEKAAREVFGCNVETDSMPVADGGEGTVEAIIDAVNCNSRSENGGPAGQIVTARVHDPLMRPIDAQYGIIAENGKQAVIEMAAGSGLTLLSEDERDPLLTTTFGTGEMIRDALDRGCRKISIAIGGSATNDGGTGCLAALGARLLDAEGSELGGRGGDLEKITNIDMSGFDTRIAESDITVMCDVTNPLCGPEGATRVFGPQKGADPDEIEMMERGMCSWRDVIKESTGIDCDEVKGAGAAGGLGAALRVFLGGKMRSGIDVVLDLIGYEERLEGADIVITGEGRTDRQSSYGKVLQGVGERAKKAGVLVVALSGSTAEGYEEIFMHGVEQVFTTMPDGMALEEAMQRAEELYYKAAVSMFRTLLSSAL